MLLKRAQSESFSTRVSRWALSFSKTLLRTSNSSAESSGRIVFSIFLVYSGVILTASFPLSVR